SGGNFRRGALRMAAAARSRETPASAAPPSAQRSCVVGRCRVRVVCRYEVSALKVAGRHTEGALTAAFGAGVVVAGGGCVRRGGKSLADSGDCGCVGAGGAGGGEDEAVQRSVADRTGGQLRH